MAWCCPENDAQAHAARLLFRYEATVRREEERTARLREAIERVLADEETGEGGWGPDVTMAAVLREALADTEDEA